MPIYEYRCTQCHEPHELRVSTQERDDQTCPKCDQPLMRRLATPHAAAIAGIPNRIGREIEGP